MIPHRCETLCAVPLPDGLMMKPRTIQWMAAALVAIFCAGTAHSQVNLPPDPGLLAENARLHIRPSYQKCINASMTVTPALMECSSKESAHQDKRSNENYKKLMSNVTGEEHV